MKKFMAVVVALGLMVSASANAQIEPMEIGVFADAAGTMSTLPATGNYPIYVVGGAMQDMKAYSFKIPGLGASFPGFILSEMLYGPAPLDVEGNDKARFVVGTGESCTSNSSATIVFANINALVTSVAVDYELCIGGDDSSGTGGPEISLCGVAGTLVEMGLAQNGGGIYGDGCGVMGATNVEFPVPVEANSFGGVKAGF